MLHKNLFLLEYMVKNRIEKDTERLDAIKNVGQLLSKTNYDIDKIKERKLDILLKKFAKIKGIPLTINEQELIDEIFTVRD